MYTSDLLPLFDVLMDNLTRFDFCEIKHVVTLFSYFCRFISSNDSDVDQSIRIRYNEWIEEFLSQVPYQTNPSLMKIQLSAVSRKECLTLALDCLLKVDQNYPNNVGIRELVNRIVTEFENSEKQSFIESSDMCSLYITFLNNYLCALKVAIIADFHNRWKEILQIVFSTYFTRYSCFKYPHTSSSIEYHSL